MSYDGSLKANVQISIFKCALPRDHREKSGQDFNTQLCCYFLNMLSENETFLKSLSDKNNTVVPHNLT